MVNDRAARIRQRRKTIFLNNLAGWLIMLPGIALFAFFVWIPILINVGNSFYSMSGLQRDAFVWFENYAKVLADPVFFQALGNTFKYIGWSILIGYLPPIVLALILSEIVKGKSIFRLGIYFPSIISGMAVVIMWSYIFDPHPNAVLNSLLGAIGIPPSAFLDDQKLAIPLIVLTMTWKGAGATMLIYLASFSNVDTNLYEAAKIDGAGIWQRVIHVTIPQVRNLFGTLFILQIISVLQVFYEPLVMTKGGGPAGASTSLLLLSYQYFFQSGDAAGSAATAVLLAIVIIVLTLVYYGVQNLFARREAQ